MKIHTLLLVLALVVTACSESTTPHPASSTDGRWQVINYWATWCKPCIEEIPELNQLAAEHGDQIKVLGVNFDGVTGQDLQAEISKLNIQFPVLEQDPSRQLGFAYPTVLPTTYVLNPDGTVVATLLGPQTLDTVLAAVKGSAATTR